MSGIETEIDGLGRVVLPIKLRRRLGLKARTRVLITAFEDALVISALDSRCALCGERIERGRKFRLCDNCISRIKTDG